MTPQPSGMVDSGTGNDPVFPQEPIEEMRDTAERWMIEWEDGIGRSTTLVGLAWYAREYDPGATVTPIGDE